MQETAMSQVELGLSKQFEVQSRVIHARERKSGLGGRFLGLKGH